MPLPHSGIAGGFSFFERPQMLRDRALPAGLSSFDFGVSFSFEMAVSGRFFSFSGEVVASSSMYLGLYILRTC